MMEGAYMPGPEWIEGYETGKVEGLALTREQRRAYEAIAALLGQSRAARRSVSEVVTIDGQDVELTVDAKWATKL